ncbi:NADAR family protein [Thalassoglobus sp.]|uniref:NADAR family protein n=1 Tax=Thalassoglobus sp. TaxID=2795869 RepID=UPI003AA8BF9B
MEIWFHSKSDTYSWLSNFSEDGFTLDGEFWPSVEHFYQAQKYVGTEHSEQIRNAESPLKARKAGKNRSLVPRPDWDEVKIVVMRSALEAKFLQNQRLNRKLLETKDHELVHESKSDSFWGRSREGTGQNYLGELLMQVREELA